MVQPQCARRLAVVFLLLFLAGVSPAAPRISTATLTRGAVPPEHLSVSTTVTMFSRALERETTYVVIMPAHPDPARRYPVLYLLHGAYGSYRDWPEHTRLLDYAAGRPLLIVCPDGGEFGWYADTATGGRIETFLTRDLIADVERRFPAVAHREGRAIAGLSMGGHGALSLGAALRMLAGKGLHGGMLAVDGGGGRQVRGGGLIGHGADRIA